MSKTVAIGHYMAFEPLTESNGSVRFQNFWVGKTATFDGNTYEFLPFGFSGITIDKQGANIDAALVFPNNALSRPWSVVSIRNHWLARVRTMILNPDNFDESPQLLYTYVGEISSGGWDDTQVNIKLNTVLDAVSQNIPRRVLNQSTVGYLPNTSNVRV
jgi:hypothetical protein